MTTHETKQKKKAMLKALEKSMGIITTASKQAGVARKTHYNWMKNDSEYRAEVEATLEVQIDFAESKLLQNIQEGKEASTIFYLKTKGKHRGYMEHVTVDQRENVIFEGINLKLNTGPEGD